MLSKGLLARSHSSLLDVTVRTDTKGVSLGVAGDTPCHVCGGPGRIPPGRDSGKFWCRKCWNSYIRST